MPNYIFLKEIKDKKDLKVTFKAIVDHFFPYGRKDGLDIDYDNILVVWHIKNGMGNGIIRNNEYLYPTDDLIVSVHNA